MPLKDQSVSCLENILYCGEGSSNMLKDFFSIEPAIAGFTDMPWQRKAAFIIMFAGVHSQLWQMTCIIMDAVLSALEL